MRQPILPMLAAALLALPALAANDLAVTLSVPKFSAIGQTSTATIQITGTSGDDVALFYPIPNGTTFSSLSKTDDTLTCTTPDVGSDGAVNCHTPTLHPPVNLTITIAIPSGTTPGTLFEHNVAVTGAFPDPNTSNNSATVTSTARVLPTLAVTSTYPASHIAGSPFQYNVTLANNGSVSTGQLELADLASTINNFDAWFTAASQTSGPAFTCTQPTGAAISVSCTGGLLNPGQSAVFSLTMTTNPTVVVGNHLHRLTWVFDDYGISNKADQTSANTQSDDVVVTSSAPSQIEPGGDLAYTINITSAGPSAAKNVTYTWTSPPATTFLSLSVGSNSVATQCNTPNAGTSGTVTCSVSQLTPAYAPWQAVADVSAIVIHLRAPAGATTLTNSVTATAANDPKISNNTSSATTTVTGAAAADLAVTMQASKPSTVVGTTVTYTATVRNNGPSPAQSVKATITGPADATFTTTSIDCTGSGPFICTVASMAMGDSRTFTFTSRPTTPGTKTCSASVTSDTNDPDTTNNTASVSVTATPRTSDLAVTATASQATVKTGESVTFTVNLAAAGPDPVDAILTITTSPAGLLPEAIVAPCSGTAAVTCPFTLGPSTSQTKTFTYRATAAGTFTATFVLATAGNDADPDPSNNTATVTITVESVGPTADLAVNGATASVLQPGSVTTYVINVINNGPSDATGVILVFTPPPFSTLESFQSASLTCQRKPDANDVLQCTSPLFGATTTATVTAAVRIGGPDVTIAVANVSVSSSTTDPNPANNSATIASLVTSVNGLALSIDPANITTTNGAAFAFNIRVANGGTAIDDVTVTDALPTGLSLVSAKPTAGTCSGTSTLVCHTGTLNLGDLVTIRVVALPTRTGVLANHASASGGAQTAGADFRVTVVPTSRRRSASH